MSAVHMIGRFSRIGRISRGILVLYGFLVTANVAAWCWAWAVFHDRPTLLATAGLAWAFGLRHAVDADHIAAIDNVVRKLMQDGKQPLWVGAWFSLGHSTVVVLASVAIAATATAFQGRLAAFKEIGGVVGTLVSAGFLLTIAAANLFILRSVWRSFQAVRQGRALDEAAFNTLLAGGGVMARLLRPVFNSIRSSWHMYPLGLLFGLGFDTATEIGLLGMSATQASQGVAAWQIMVFPALFTSGMALVDSTDSVLMVGAYGWAFVHPIRKLWYNLTITAASVVSAVLIGGVEALGLVADQLDLTGVFWDGLRALNEDFGYLGFAVIGVFVLCWIASSVLYRYHRYDEQIQGG